MKEKILRWWYFKVNNPVIRKGEKGGFKWTFRRFWLDISTVSGNFKARFMAAEHPFGYLVSGKDDSNIEGFCQTMYEVGMLLTTDQGFVNDVQKALKKYSSRIEKKAKVVEDEDEERAALEWEKQVQEYVETPKRQRRRAARNLKEDH